MAQGLRRSGLARDDYWLTTKITFEDFEPTALRASALQSLTDLGVEHLDLLLLHWPVGGEQVVADALGELGRMRVEGIVRELGVSNVPAEC